MSDNRSFNKIMNIDNNKSSSEEVNKTKENNTKKYKEQTQQLPTPGGKTHQ